MKYLDGRRCGWDTESTGVNPLEDRIVTAAIVVRGGGREDRDFSFLINPGVPIPAAASDIHGVTDDMVQADGRAPKEVLDEIAGQLAAAINWGMPVVAFNQSYDWTILHHDLRRNGLPTVEDRISTAPYELIDPHVLDRQITPRVRGKGARKLKPTCERYGISLEDWHKAEADALAALLLADAMFSYHPKLAEMGPEQLFAAQQAWRAEQQAGLQAHLRKTDPTAYCAPEWPLLPAQRDGGAA